VAGSSLGGVIALDAVRRGFIHPAALVLRAPPVDRRQFAGVAVPTLVVVGGHDPLLSHVHEATGVSEWTTVRVVEDASHLFEEPGTLEQAVEETVNWFQGHLTGEPEPSLFNTGVVD
jgi:putative phosphoribosyl transferase